jgi:flagellar biosynthesis protein FlhA
MAIIIETLADVAPKTQDTAILVEQCRRVLGPHITKEYLMPDGSLKALGLHPNLESMLKKTSNRDGTTSSALAMNPAIAHEILQKITDSIKSARSKGFEPVLLCSPAIRPVVRQMIMSSFKDTAVLSYAEVPDSIQIDIQGMIPAPKEDETAAILEGAI